MTESPKPDQEPTVVPDADGLPETLSGPTVDRESLNDDGAVERLQDQVESGEE